MRGSPFAAARRLLRPLPLSLPRAEERAALATHSPLTCRRLLLPTCRLSGGLRRLDVRAGDEYDDAECAEAAAAVAAAAAELAASCASGWSLPWGLRAWLAEMLLRGAFDTLEPGQYVEEAEELLAVLAASVWPALGVSRCAHLAVYAWVHYRQYCTAPAELSLLEAARAVILRAGQELGAGGGGEGAEEAGGVGGEAAGAAGAGADAGFPAQVMACIAAAASARLSDYHRLVRDPREMRALLAVLAATEAARGREAELPKALQACIAASVEAAFDRKLEELVANVPVGACPRVCVCVWKGGRRPGACRSGLGLEAI